MIRHRMLLDSVAPTARLREAATVDERDDRGFRPGDLVVWCLRETGRALLSRAIDEVERIGHDRVRLHLRPAGWQSPSLEAQLRAAGETEAADAVAAGQRAQALGQRLAPTPPPLGQREDAEALRAEATDGDPADLA